MPSVRGDPAARGSRVRHLHGPEGYSEVPPEYRLWIWAADVPDAMGRLNLVPAPALVTA